MNTEQPQDHPSVSTSQAPCGEKAGQSRADHLAWCKRRALEYLDTGDTQGAFASMASDLQKHPGTEGHKGMEIGLMLLMVGSLSTPHDMRRFIEGFN